MERFFQKELETFRSNLALMGSKAMAAVRNVSQALSEHDLDLATQVRENDDEIDNLEVRLDAEAVRYMSLRNPVAGDLRLLIVGMKASHDLERVGDEATNIAKRVQRIVQGEPHRSYVDLSRIAQAANDMLQDALDSFFEGNIDKAKAILERDEAVDDLDKQIHRDLVAGVRSNPAGTEFAMELMFISHSFERIADHSCNIAEEVIYLIEARDVRHH